MDGDEKTPLELAQAYGSKQVLLDVKRERDVARRKEFGQSSGLTALLRHSQIDRSRTLLQWFAIVDLAIAWLDKEGIATVDEVIDLDLTDEFVAALELNDGPATRLSEALRDRPRKKGKEEL